MAGLGNLVVKILGDTKDVKAKLNDVDKRLKTFTKTTEKQTKTLGSSIKKMMMWGAAIGGAIMALRKMSQFVTSSLRAYMEQEDAIMKLNAALKATGRYSEDTEKALHNFATEMMYATGIGDELFVSAAGIMTTFTQISTRTFPEALEAAANMSKMFGQDLQQSVIQLGTALNDPIMGVGRLKRIGISFSEDQKDSIKLFMEQNNIMAAQRVILDELQLEIGNTARALGETFAGKLSIVKELVGELKEGLGKLMAEQLEPLLDWMIAFLREGNNMEIIIRVVRGLGATFATVFGYIFRVFQTYTKLVKWLVEDTKNIGRTFAVVFNPKNWKPGRVKEALADLQWHFKETAASIAEDWETYANNTYDRWAKVFGKLGEKTTEIGTGVATVVAPAIEEVKDELSDLAKEMSKDITVWDANIDKWNTYYRLMKDSAHPIMVVKTELSDLAKEMQKDITVWDATVDRWETFARIHSYKVIPQIERTKTVMEGFKGSIEKFAITTEDVTDRITGAWLNSFENMFDVTKTIGENIKNFVKSMVATVIRAFAQQLLAASTGMLINPFTFLQGLAGIAKAGAMFTMASIVENLARGGLATKETLAVVGEGKHEEAVLPLSEEVFDKLGKGITNAIAKQQSTVNVSPGQTLIHNVVTLDGRVVYDCVNRGIVDGKIRGQMRGQ